MNRNSTDDLDSAHTALVQAYAMVHMTYGDAGESFRNRWMW